MRHGKVGRHVLAPRLHRLGQSRLAACSQKMLLCVQPDEQGEFDVGQLRQQTVQPKLRAFPSRRQVPTLPSAGVAIPHRDDRHLRRIVEDIGLDSHPATQLLAAGIVKGNAGRVYLRPGRLADHEDTRIAPNLQDGPRTMRQVFIARPAVTYFTQQLIKPAKGYRRATHQAPAAPGK